MATHAINLSSPDIYRNNLIPLSGNKVLREWDYFFY